MDKKALFVLGLAIVFAAVTAYAVNRWIKQRSQGSAVSDTQKVVVAVSPISLGQRITPDQVTLEEFPKAALPEGTLDDVSQVVDRVSLAEVAIREPILMSRLAPEGSAAGLSAVIPAGLRAMTVKVDEVIGVAGFVAPGTFVDVVATIRGTQGNSTSRTILQRVKVLASGTQTETKDSGPVEVKTVTLQVTPEQAEALALASSAGRLQLVMRNSIDENKVATAGVDTTSLLRGRSRARPVSAPRQRSRKVTPVKEVVPPPKPATVELIQGAERRTVTFQQKSGGHDGNVETQKTRLP